MSIILKYVGDTTNFQKFEVQRPATGHIYLPPNTYNLEIGQRIELPLPAAPKKIKKVA
jgi:hypothetical protein